MCVTAAVFQFSFQEIGNVKRDSTRLDFTLDSTRLTRLDSTQSVARALFGCAFFLDEHVCHTTLATDRLGGWF
jgi:hypothetical protein